jgi:hypothetical protein
MWLSLYLVFSRRLDLLPRFTCEFRRFSRYLVFSRPEDYSAEYPKKISRFDPISSCAISQGSRSNGGGTRSGSGFRPDSSAAAARASSLRATASCALRRLQLAWVLRRRSAWHSGREQARCRRPTRGSARNHRRQMQHGRFLCDCIGQVCPTHGVQRRDRTCGYSRGPVHLTAIRWCTPTPRSTVKQERGLVA